MLKRILANCGVLAIALLSACSGGSTARIPSSLTNAVSSDQSAAGSPAARDSIQSTTVAPAHVLTADYLGGYAGTHTVAYATAAKYLSWAEVEPEDANAIYAAGMKTLDYLDPFRQSATDPLYNSDSATFSHNCSGDDIVIDYQGATPATQYLMNPNSSQLVTLLNNWEKSQESQGHFNAFFFDNVDDLLETVNPCNVSDATWDAWNASFINQSAYPVVFSGYALSSEAGSLITGSHVLGGVVEDCYSRTSQPTPPYTTGSFWIQDENLEIAAGNYEKSFFCYNNGTEVASTSMQLRNYVYASFLLTYQLATTVLWESYTTTSGLHVFPETELVPTSPVKASVGSVSQLETSNGLYAREYTTCYLAGKSVGHCAVIVNSGSTSTLTMPKLTYSYAHSLSLSGAGLVDGGTASATGAAPPASVPPETGVIAIQ